MDHILLPDATRETKGHGEQLLCAKDEGLPHGIEVDGCIEKATTDTELCCVCARAVHVCVCVCVLYLLQWRSLCGRLR